MKKSAFAIILACCIPASANAGGLARTEDFVVLVAAEGDQIADHAFAQEVARKAAEYRGLIAKEWLGEELPPSVGRAYLSVLITESEDTGQTWPKNDLTDEYHHVHMSTSRAKALGGTLGHEVCHVVLRTRYARPGALANWASEGIASRYDGPERVAIRRRILAWYAETDQWPSLTNLLNAKALPAKDKAAYAAAVSLTEFLLSKGDKQTFLEFATRGSRDGWDGALSSHYRIQSVDELQTLWQQWAWQAYSGERAASKTSSVRRSTVKASE